MSETPNNTMAEAATPERPPNQRLTTANKGYKATARITDHNKTVVKGARINTHHVSKPPSKIKRMKVSMALEGGQVGVGGVPLVSMVRSDGQHL
jgi:hypothetical protein